MTTRSLWSWAYFQVTHPFDFEVFSEIPCTIYLRPYNEMKYLWWCKFRRVVHQSGGVWTLHCLGGLIFKRLWWCPSELYVEDIGQVSFSIIVKTPLKKLLYFIIPLIQSGKSGVISTFVTPTYLKFCSSPSKVHSWNAA